MNGWDDTLMKLKIRRIKDGETVDFKIVPIKTLDEVRYLKGMGVEKKTIQELQQTGRSKVDFLDGEIHFLLTVD